MTALIVGMAAMTDQEIEDLLANTWNLIQHSRAECDSLRSDVEQSLKTIDRTREIIVQLDQLWMMAESR